MIFHEIHCKLTHTDFLLFLHDWVGRVYFTSLLRRGLTHSRGRARPPSHYCDLATEWTYSVSDLEEVQTTQNREARAEIQTTPLQSIDRSFGCGYIPLRCAKVIDAVVLHFNQHSQTTLTPNDRMLAQVTLTGKRNPNHHHRGVRPTGPPLRFMGFGVSWGSVQIMSIQLNCTCLALNRRYGLDGLNRPSIYDTP